MAQAKRTAQKVLTLDDVLGTPEEQKVIKDDIARMKRRYRRYKGTIEETQAALAKDMGDKLLSDYVMEGHGHVWKDGEWR